jgi:hypothetical protein
LQKQEEINLYGIDGSKPGAAAAGVWLSHRAIGLHENGIIFYLNTVISPGLQIRICMVARSGIGTVAGSRSTF